MPNRRPVYFDSDITPETRVLRVSRSPNNRDRNEDAIYVLVGDKEEGKGFDLSRYTSIMFDLESAREVAYTILNMVGDDAE